MNNQPIFIVEKIHPNAQLPTYGTTKAADCDLYAVEPMVIRAGTRELVKTGIKMIIPPGYRLKLESRSGLAYKSGINIGAGVIDEDYRQEIGVVVFNHGAQDLDITPGMKICQASIEQYIQGSFEWGCVPERDESSNRDGGFGSTGA